LPTTKIGGYELDEHLIMDEKMSFFDTVRKSIIFLRGGGGKLHVCSQTADEMQHFVRLSYPSPDAGASAETHVATIHCYHFYGSWKWSDFREELRYIKKTGILVNRYDNDQDPNWPKDVEFEGYFFSHQTRRAFIQLRYLKNNAAEPRTVKLIHYVNLKIGGDDGNDQGVWDANRKAFRCWDAVNSKACYMLVGSPTTPSYHTIADDTTVYSEAWGGQLTDRDSYGPGNAAVALQFNITLAAGASTVLPFYIVVGDSQIDVEAEWDTLVADDYSKLLSDTKVAWESWVNAGIIATFEDNPWMSEAWIRNVISAYEMTWSNGGISASAGGPYTQCFVWDSFFAIRALLQAGHIAEVRSYLQFLRTCVAADSFNPYPASSYKYDNTHDTVEPGGPDLVHGCYLPIILIYELYQKTKTLTDLSDNWAMVKKYLDFVKDNFYNATYDLIVGLGYLDHPYRYHTRWAEGKYYASFAVGYQKGFEVGAQIADLTSHPTEKAIYEQVASELQTAIDQRFKVDSVYKSVWHPTSFPTAEGWDIELSSMYGRTGYVSDTEKKTFKEWEKWLKDYFPPHFDEVNYSANQDWLYASALADFLHSLILYGDYGKALMLYSRFKHISNYPKLQTGERVKQYETSLTQTIFAWSHAVSGSLARLFDWTKDADGNYVFSISPAPEVGKFKAVFPDGTSITVSGEGNGSRAIVTVKPYVKAYTWDGDLRKLNVTLKPDEDLEFDVAMGGYFGLAERGAFNRKADLYGEKVEVQKKVLVGSDEFGNPVYDYVTFSVENAIIKALKGTEDVVKAGLLAVGDALGHFKADSDIDKNYRVKTANTIYEAISVEKIRNQGLTIYIEAGLRRVV